jgi:hypothetical protein
MKLTTIAAVAATLTIAPIAAQAAIITYACEARDQVGGDWIGDKGLHAAKHDTSRRTLTFLGKVYRNVNARAPCPSKGCWGNDRVTLDRLTDAMASLSVLFGPGSEGYAEFDCTELLDR